MIQTSLLPKVCQVTDLMFHLVNAGDYTKAWDFYPEKKIEFLVKGFSHLPLTYKWLRSICKPGQNFPIGTDTHSVFLQKEPGNQFDSNAIAVWCHKQGTHKLGYIPKWLTSCIHKEWDRIGVGYIHQVIDINSSLTACRVVMGYDGYIVNDLEAVDLSERFDDLAEEVSNSIETYK